MLRALSIVLVLTACQSDETVSGYGGADRVWVLTSLNDAAFSARATLTFPEEGKIAGEAPCNSYFGAQTAPYPWFKAESIGATRRACPELDAESKYLEALSQATISEISGEILILSNDDGLSMLFSAEPAP
jgi:heat shock protein HslJ